MPTVSRPTLARSLLSLKGQDWRPGDEVLLVGDGPQPLARELWGQLGLPGRYVETPARLGVWGHGVRNFVIERGLVRTSHAGALDDDDCFTPGAVAAVRAALAAEPARPHLFRMDWRAIGGRVLWEEAILREGNVGTPMFWYRNAVGRLGRWGDRYTGDFDFIRGTCALQGEPVWRREVAVVCRPFLLASTPAPGLASKRADGPELTGLDADVRDPERPESAESLGDSLGRRFRLPGFDATALPEGPVRVPEAIALWQSRTALVCQPRVAV